MNYTKNAIMNAFWQLLEEKPYGKFGSPLDCIIPLIENCINRKKAILHIYHSIHREAFLNELDRICFYAVNQYIDTITTGLTLIPDDKKLLIRFYKCTLTGIILDWLNDGMNYDPYEPFSRICELFEGSGKNAFLKCTVDKIQS